MSLPRSRTREYRSWDAARSRCYKPRDIAYARYGGRGIVMCDAWRSSFEAFLADMGPRPLEHTLDRINNDGPYTPSNCRWATKLQQDNNRRDNRRIAIDGRVQTLKEWARAANICSVTLSDRLKRGWTPVQAITEPVAPQVQRDSLTFRGETRMLGEWAPIVGIAVDILRTRLWYGWPIERAFTQPVRHLHKLTFDGRTQTLRAWARELNISRGKLYQRLVSGWSVERALSA